MGFNIIVKEAIKNDFTELLLKIKDNFTQSIAIAGRIGKWGIIDVCAVNDGIHSSHIYALLEHNTYGDSTCGLLVRLNIYISEWEEVAETYDSLAQALYDEDIIDKMPDWD